MLQPSEISGRWIAGPNRGSVACVQDFRAGLLVTHSSLGELTGQPADFRCDDGKSGIEILGEILVAPTCEELHHGAIREAIASVRSVALYGFSETRAWDGAGDYIVDSGEGAVGVVRFGESDCFGAMVSLDPSRNFDVDAALQAAPTAIKQISEEVLRLPLLVGASTAPVTAVFWSERGPLTSCEDWVSVYQFGAEILGREFLSDDAWVRAATDHYELAPDLAGDISRLARTRRARSGIITLGAPLFRQLAPRTAPHYEDATRLLAELSLVRGS